MGLRSISIGTILIFCLLISIQGRNFYYDTLKTNISELNSINSTVVISESQDIGTCTCDLTPSACDYFCCCDIDCPTNITAKWIDDPNNICLDKKNLDNDYLTHCFSENMLYHFNRKRGMREYRDPVSNLFCVTFDNSSIMGQFYRDIQSIASSTLNQIYQKYVDDHYNKYYYFNKDTGVVQNVNFYKVGDYVGIRQNKTQNNFVLDGKFFIYHSGPFGDCTKTNAIKYMQPNERVTCGLRLGTFNNCASYSWDKLTSYRMLISSDPGPNPVYINVLLNNVLIHDYDTGKTTKVEDLTKIQETSLSASEPDCICNNFLEEASYTFIIDKNLMIITGVYLDLILATNVRNSCLAKYTFDMKFSSKFYNNLNSNLIRSGSPGYLKGYKLNIGYNSTDPVTALPIFEVPKEGVFTVGRRENTSCSPTSGQTRLFTLESRYDHPIDYGVNSMYSCTLKFNLIDYQAFCKQRAYKNYVIYQFPRNIQYIGIFGNSNPQYRNDWSQVIIDYDLDQSKWSDSTRSCYFPDTIFLDVLTSKAGAVINPQEYVVSARVSARYEENIFESNNNNEVLTFKVKFITNFVSLTEENINTTRKYPSIIPGLPNDIVAPLVAGA